MRIAINTRFLLPTKMEGFGWYTYEVVKRLVENHPEHEFILFFDRKYEERFVFGKNATPVILNPPARHPLLFYIWFEHSVRRALKKYKADIFFSPDGYLSLKSDIKQIGVIHDINFEHNPQDIPKRMRNYLRSNFPKFAKKADHILTVSEYSKQDICSTYGIHQKNVTVAWNGASELFKPIPEKKQDTIRNKYTSGDPYLLFVGALHPRKNVDRLIQAFKIFKEKHPETKEKLVIVGEELFGNQLGAFKIPDSIRPQIVFTGHVSHEELAKIMGAAKIFTFVPYFEGFGIPLVEAMKCGTPILSADKTSLPEVAGEAALYCDPFDVQDIAEKLEQLALNNELMQKLSKLGLNRSKLFNWEKTAEAVWDVICKISEK